MTLPKYKVRRRGRSSLAFLLIRTIKNNRTSVVETRSLNMDRFQSRQMIDRKVFKVAERVFSNLNSLQSRTLLNAKEASRRSIHVLVIAASETIPSNLHIF